MRSIDVADFLIRLAPSLMELGKALFSRHKGDIVSAEKEIAKILEHGEKFKAFDSAARAELERLKRKSTPAP